MRASLGFGVPYFGSLLGFLKGVYKGMISPYFFSRFFKAQVTGYYLMASRKRGWFRVFGFRVFGRSCRERGEFSFFFNLGLLVLIKDA